MSPRR